MRYIAMSLVVHSNALFVFPVSYNEKRGTGEHQDHWKNQRLKRQRYTQKMMMDDIRWWHGIINSPEIIQRTKDQDLRER